ncbi:MAG: hypothetical protein HPY89_10045 [Pelotomaculum sp.]|nr:hypothetical protein [Pelotomaculum sp.]
MDVPPDGPVLLPGGAGAKLPGADGNAAGVMKNKSLANTAFYGILFLLTFNISEHSCNQIK